MTSDGMQTESLAVTENYEAWLSIEPDGEWVYHVELGSVTLNLFMEEWQELTRLVRSNRIPRQPQEVIDRYLVWVADDPDGGLLYNLEMGEATLYFEAEEWAEVVELIHTADQQAAKKTR